MTFVCGVNSQKQTGLPDGLPFLYVLDDWDSSPLAGATEYRLMNRSAYSLFPAGTHVVIGNEDDDEGPSGWDGQTLDQQPASVQSAYGGDNARWQLQHLWDVRRAWRLPILRACHDRSLIVHCPAEKWFEREQYDPIEVAMCDVVDVHMAVFEETIPTSIYGKPVWVTEIEADPNIPEQMAQIPVAAHYCRHLGIPVAFAWGSDPQRANVNDYPDILAQLKALNGTPIPEGEATMAVDINDLAKRVAALEERDRDITEAVRRITQGQYQGASGSAGEVVALEGGSDPSLQPQPDASPKA